MLAAGDIAINRLRIRAGVHDARTLAGELYQATWPVAVQSRAWIFVRELHVTADARLLRNEAGRQLGHLLAQAMDGRLAAAVHANVVSFQSFPELLAFLLRDLVLGQASHWYWARWAYLLRKTRSEAVAQLLCEHVEYLPAVVNQLIKYRQLATIWAALSPGAAREVARVLARVQGFTLGNVHLVSHPESSSGSVDKGSWRQPLLLHPWLPILSRLDSGDGRLILAAVAHLLQHSPVTLMVNADSAIHSFATALRELAHTTTAISRDIPSSANLTLISLSATNPISTQHSAPNTSGSITVQNAGSAEGSVASGVSNPSATTSNSIDLNKTSGSAVSGPAAASPGEQLAVPEPYVPDEVAINHADDAAEAGFTTACGGVFYLLNPLARLLADERAFPANETGWVWLWDMLRLLGERHAHLATAADEPLRRFIATQLYPELLMAEALTQLHARPISTFSLELFTAMESGYEHEPFWQELTLTTGFLAVDAQVIATASHVDVYLPLNRVRLDLRLAAWDVNPGWLPWLGRVVAFHFIQQTGVSP